MAGFDEYPDSDRLRSCLWPDVLEGALVLRVFDTQLYIDLSNTCADVLNRTGSNLDLGFQYIFNGFKIQCSQSWLLVPFSGPFEAET